MAPDRFGFLTDTAFRGFFVGPAPLHVAEGALALHLFLKHPQGRIDVVVANEDLHNRDAFPKARVPPPHRRQEGEAGVVQAPPLAG